MSDSLSDWLADTLSEFGTVSSRKMFGGAGVYMDGAIFAILADDEVWLKSDAETDAEYDAARMARFVFDFGEKTGTMNYRRLPSAAYDDPDVLKRWAVLAIGAGQRAPRQKRKPRKR